MRSGNGAKSLRIGSDVQRFDPEFRAFERPGSDLLSHALRRSTIGAEGLNGRVRNGIGCFPLAITTRPFKRTDPGTPSPGMRPPAERKLQLTVAKFRVQDRIAAVVVSRRWKRRPAFSAACEVYFSRSCRARAHDVSVPIEMCIRSARSRSASPKRRTRGMREQAYRAISTG